MLSERQLEDMLFEALVKGEYNMLLNKGLHIDPTQKWYRQVNLANYGVADIVGFSVYPAEKNRRSITVKIIELKAVGFESRNLGQINRYATGIYRYLESIGTDYEKADIYIEKTLIVKKDSLSQDSKYCLNFLENIEVFEFSFDLVNGVYFNRISSDWIMQHENNINFNNSHLPRIKKELTYLMKKNFSELRNSELKNENYKSLFPLRQKDIEI